MKLLSRLFLPVILMLALHTSSALAGEERDSCDILIQGGRIVDGSGNPWYYGDVCLRGDRILRVGRLEKLGAKRRINAQGLVVAPGFIDMMGQSEWNVLIDPRAESKVFQGITTEITGEGSSIAPLRDFPPKDDDFLVRYQLSVDWLTLGDYFARLERTPPAINIASFVGAAQVRRLVMDTANRPPTGAELEQMGRIVGLAMDDGALGLSSALVYPPGAFAGTGELIALARVAAGRGGIYATHLRSEGNAFMEALDEALRIGKEAQLPVEVFHLKAMGSRNRGKMKQAVARISAAREAGMDITADIYPYTAASTSLYACIPPAELAQGEKRFQERLKEIDYRKRLKQEIRNDDGSWENFYRAADGAGGVMVVRVANRSLARYEGKRLDEIAAMMGHRDDLDALFDLLMADNSVTAVYFLMNEEDVRLAMRQPWSGFCTDGAARATTGPLAEGKTHPRAFGGFARVLDTYVRREGVLTLEEAIRKLTSRQALRVGLRERGLLAPGYFADLTIFNPATISDKATYADPMRLSEGVRYLLVNGRLVIDEGQQTSERPGRALRGPAWRRR